MIKKIIKYFKLMKFKKLCPDVRCTCCNNLYFDENDHGHCKLAEELGL
jgi:hypothetical protein